ncbi:hypothetical protein [Candidatus Poriferisodalis sp.]|uniref:hypothetical protein n=1 Tax=Candidatus Poriferisodalis sp. TaxID=3101277 RepID=UPI003B01400E
MTVGMVTRESSASPAANTETTAAAAQRRQARDLRGEPQALLAPFRYSRYAEGRLHPVSNSPYP